jgi:putative endonuclease
MVIVYVLRSLTNGKRYVGMTDNLSRRLAQHRRTRSTVEKLLGAFEVLLTEEFPDYALARAREKFLKSGQGREWLGDRFGVVEFNAAKTARRGAGENTCLGGKRAAF